MSHPSKLNLTVSIEQKQAENIVRFPSEKELNQLRGYAWRLGVLPQDIDDVIQEFYVRILNYPMPNRPMAWWRRVIYSIVMSMFRRNTIRRTADFDPQLIIDWRNDTLANALESELQHVIRAMPDRYRAAVLGRLDGLTLEEIAAVNDCSSKSISRRLSWAQRQLEIFLA